MLYAQRKLASAEVRQLRSSLNGVLYACGSTIQELDCDVPILTKVYVRANLTCSDPVEVPYYNQKLSWMFVFTVDVKEIL